MLSPAVLAFFAAHHGIASRSDLRALGLTDDQIRHLIRSGRCERLRKGVYRLTSCPWTFESEAVAACSVAPDVFLSHRSAGRFIGLRKCHFDRLEVACPGPTKRAVPNAVVHRSHRIAPDDVVIRGDGIRLSSVERTVFDLASVLTDAQFESVVEQVLHDKLTTAPGLMQIGERLRERGRDGSARFGRILEARSPESKAVDSDLELRVDRALRRAGVPLPVRQHEFVVSNGRTIRVDFYWPAAGLVLEVDHSTWHSDRHSIDTDKWRDRQLSLAGVVTMRVTERDVDERLEQVVWEVASLVRHRSVAARGHHTPLTAVSTRR